MDENTKRRFDAVIELYNGCWRRITERRTYEWRAAFTLWAAFGAFIVIILTKPIEVGITFLCWSVFAIGLFLFLIHVFWLKGLGKKHDDDRKMAGHYGKIIRELSDSNFNKSFQEYLDNENEQRGLLRDWSRRCQLAVTLVLWIALVLVVKVFINH